MRVMKTLGMVGVLVIFSIFLTIFNSHSQGPPSPARKEVIPPEPKIDPSKLAIPDYPNIRVFTIEPKVKLDKDPDPLKFQWEVNPAPGGSPIKDVKIYKETTPIFTGLPASGIKTYADPIPPGQVQFRLTAVNTANKLSSQVKSIRVISVQELLMNLKIGLDAKPPEFREGKPIDFVVVIIEHAATLKPVNIFVTYQGRVLGSLMNQTIDVNMRPCLFTIKTPGFNIALGEYLVDLEYMGLHKVKKFRTVPTQLYKFEIAP